MQLFQSPSLSLSLAGSNLCAQVDPEAFFPERVTATSTAYAKAICALCDSQPECLQQAMARREEYGVWGGLDEKERRSLRRKPRAAGAA
ncbi:WhiB family transcriptional regulator [Streptomyces sp. NPDC057540]|uniref:WhiB family transcriptional regulator n=1 Tax=Streptomyces sp. NPDC057540 TaxID=3346160 RepID=UPI0036B6F939